MESKKIMPPSALAAVVPIIMMLLSSPIFTPSLCAQSTIWSSSTVPSTASAADTSAVELGVKFQSNVSGFIKGIRFYKGSANTGAHVGHLWTRSGTLLGSVTFTSETATGWQEADFASPIAITAHTTYVASYHTNVGGYAFNLDYFLSNPVSNPPLVAPASGTVGGNGVYIYGPSAFPNHSYDGSNYWVDVDFTANQTPTAVSTIWSNSTVPSTASAADSSAVELGVKFQSNVSGFIKGIRFYKGSANTGAHVGHLWTSSGTLLGSVTFTRETATGWQEADFASPIAITAHTTYVASYHTNVGGYAFNLDYFSSNPVSNPPLVAPASGTVGGNGVYIYGPSAFPNHSYDGSNYWVDVDFTTTTSQTSLTIVTSSLPAGVVGTAYNATLSVTGGTSPYAWSLASGQLSPGLTLNSNGTIAGVPTAAGPYSFTVKVADSGGNQQSQPITMSINSAPVGGGTYVLSASPTSTSFGNVTVGSSNILPVMIRNTGTGSVKISQATITGAGFSVSGPTLPLTLASGQDTSFSVTFDPASASSVTGSLSVVSNATNSPIVESLSATGVNQHSVSLSWAASASPNITGYNVYRGAVSGGPYTKLNLSLVTGTTYTDKTVQAGQTYYYVTTAMNSQSVESADSNQALAVVPSP